MRVINMPTYSALAKQYSDRIKSALTKDGFTVSSRISPSSLRNSATLKELRAIRTDIDGLVYTEFGKSLSENDKNRVIGQIQKELSMPDPMRMEKQVKSAKNDLLPELAETIQNILKD